MLRFLLKRDIFHEMNQYRDTTYTTIDADVPELENRLTSGGCGESGFDKITLINVEVLGRLAVEIKPNLIIPTLEGDHLCSVGDFIVRGVKGEFYPCKPDIFQMTYEPVKGE